MHILGCLHETQRNQVDTGLDTERATVNVSAGNPAVRNFILGSAVYMLDAVKVASEKAPSRRL